jgi:hypothetical protein
MSEEIYCSKCHNKTEETLLLSCEHNLCIPCAAENLSRQESKGINKTQLVICDLCGSETEIDNETSKEILSMAVNNSNENNNYMNYSSNLNDNNNNIDFNNNSNGIVNLTYFNQSNTNNNNNNFNYNDNICNEHGEPLTYLCLDCLSKCVCAECVVHGIHKNHEVMNIKKAYPLVYGKSEELCTHVDDKIKELKMLDNLIEKKKGEITNLTEKCKNDIKSAFEQIRIKLNQKEKEILVKAENSLMENIQELNTYNHIIRSKIISLNKLIDTINAHLLRKDELKLINFYCENKNKILNQSEVVELNNMPNLETLSNLRIDIDKSSFDTMINALNSLHFEINTMKPIKQYASFDTQNYSTKRQVYGMDFKNKISDNNPLNFNYNNNSGMIPNFNK